MHGRRRRHLGAESELDLAEHLLPLRFSLPLLRASSAAAAAATVAENRDPRSSWRRVEELGYGESAGAAGPGALENAWEGRGLGRL